MIQIWKLSGILWRSGLSVLLGGCLLLGGCANNNPAKAPVMNGRAQNGYYRVQRGDTLYRIGLRFNQDVNTLVRWNHLANPHAIEVGQLIRVRLMVRRKRVLILPVAGVLRLKQRQRVS